MNNARREDETIDHRLLKVGTFGSYKNTYDFRSNIDSLSACSFLGNSIFSMATSSSDRSWVDDFETHCTCNEIVVTFKRHLKLFGMDIEGEVNLGTCFKMEKIKMVPRGSIGLILHVHASR